jgi:hypothetical protein
MLLAASSAFGITISTGTAAPWLVNGNPVAVETVLSTPIWINNFGDGRWVGTTVNDGNPSIGIAPGTYTFTLAIGSYLGGAGTFSLQYAADNSVQWTLSGGTLGGSTQCDSVLNPSSDCFQNVSGAPRTLTGTFGAGSVLTATVVNGGSTANPMGLLVVGNADPVGAIPEPSTYAMLTLGGVAVAVARLRKK